MPITNAITMITPTLRRVEGLVTRASDYRNRGESFKSEIKIQELMPNKEWKTKARGIKSGGVDVITHTYF